MWERRCLDSEPTTSSGGGRTTGPGGGAPSTVGTFATAGAGPGSDVGGSDIGSACGDRISTVGGLEYSLVSSEPVTHDGVAFPPESASKSTMRFSRFLRGFALAAERSGDGLCDEEGENGGLLEGLAPIDAAGGTATAAAAMPTGTTGGE